MLRDDQEKMVCFHHEKIFLRQKAPEICSMAGDIHHLKIRYLASTPATALAIRYPIVQVHALVISIAIGKHYVRPKSRALGGEALLGPANGLLS